METNQELFQFRGFSLSPKLTKEWKRLMKGSGTVWNAIAECCKILGAS